MNIERAVELVIELVLMMNLVTVDQHCDTINLRLWAILRYVGVVREEVW